MTALAGFSGVGKTTMVSELVTEAQRPSVVETVPANGYGMDDLCFNLAEALEKLGYPAVADHLGESVSAAFTRALTEPVLIVLDDFQELLDTQGHPPSDFRKMVTALGSKIPALPGRLLLVSNRAPAEGAWLEKARVRRVEPPPAHQATELLAHLLADRNLEDDIPLNLREDVVHWLGCNPRAIHALVACLSHDSLDDLIDLNSDSWDARDEVISEEFLRQLEERFMSRILSHLSADAHNLLMELSVYRKPFTKEAIQQLKPYITSLEPARKELASLFILEHMGRWYRFNRVSRELARSSMLGDKRKANQLHRHAADYYTRHFLARQKDSRIDRSSDFVEARFHLLRSENNRQFEEIAAEFRSQLHAMYGNGFNVPSDHNSRQQLLVTLSAALDGVREPHSILRLLFAKLLLARALPGDEVLAYRQLTLACRGTKASEVWVRRTRLAAEVDGPTAISAIITQAKKELSAAGFVEVVCAAVKALAKEGYDSEARGHLDRLDDSLYEQGNSFVLFQLYGAILAREGKYREAVSKTLSGYLRLRSTPGPISRLVEQSAMFAAAAKDLNALKQIQILIVQNGGDSEWYTLCEMLKLQCGGHYAQAAELAKPYPRYITTRLQQVFCLLCLGNAEEAAEILDRLGPRHSAGWLKAVTALSLDPAMLSERAGRWLSDFAAEQGVPVETVSAKYLIECWDRVGSDIGLNVAFYFPELPSSMTGLSVNLHRLQSGGTALNNIDLHSARFSKYFEASPNGRFGNGVERPHRPPGGEVRVFTNGGPAILVGQQTLNQGDLYMESKYNVGQAGAVGDNATATGNTFQQVNANGASDLNKLALELQRLSIELRNVPEGERNAAGLAQIDAAAAAAADGDEARTKSHLARAGTWALNAATAVGTGLAAAWIKTALGV
ncbi:ATP-binding protein [Streptomyces sp. NPDC018972]|uniref:ATP-binding protein n=1 Tax=Streptomyces sp. NPDC018972 TaxID=3365060 RepID=UPI00378E7447